jgi:antitoxin HicB
MVVQQELSMSEAAIRLHIERLDEGGYLATSPDVPGLIAEGRSLVEVAEIAQDVARKIAESCREHGDELPPALQNFDDSKPIDLTIPIGVG